MRTRRISFDCNNEATWDSDEIYDDEEDHYEEVLNDIMDSYMDVIELDIDDDGSWTLHWTDRNTGEQYSGKATEVKPVPIANNYFKF